MRRFSWHRWTHHGRKAVERHDRFHRWKVILETGGFEGGCTPNSSQYLRRLCRVISVPELNLSVKTLDSELDSRRLESLLRIVLGTPSFGVQRRSTRVHVNGEVRWLLATDSQSKVLRCARLSHHARREAVHLWIATHPGFRRRGIAGVTCAKYLCILLKSERVGAGPGGCRHRAERASRQARCGSENHRRAGPQRGDCC